MGHWLFTNESFFYALIIREQPLMNTWSGFVVEWFGGKYFRGISQTQKGTFLEGQCRYESPFWRSVYIGECE